MMANDPYSKRLTSIKGKCQAIKFTKIHTNTINAQLKRICDAEGIKYDAEVLKQLSKQSNGDLRSAITSLEAIVDSSKIITQDSLAVISQKDGEQNVFDTVRTILKSKTPAHVIDAMRVDTQPQFLIELVAENIPREYDRVDEIAKAYEMIALADLNLARAFRTQDYTYWKYAFFFMGRGVAAAKAKTYKKFARYTNSTVYAKLSKSRKNKNLIAAVTAKMSKRLHTSPLELERQIPFYTVMFEDNERAYDFKEYFKLEDEDVKLFRSRKIPASIEKKRIKELQKQQKEEEKAIQKAKKEALKRQKESSDKEEVMVVEDEIKADVKKSSEKTKPVRKDSTDKKTKSVKKSRDTPKIQNDVTDDSSNDNKSNDDGDNSKNEDNKPKSKQTTLFDF